MFRLLGFDVHVRAGFVMFLGLIIVLYQDGFGVWLAGALAVFTLLHELGHAVAARSAGAEASISLDFLAGYTSFRPGRPIPRTRRAVISAAGPAVQIAASVAVLVAMGVDPLSLDSVRQTDASAAIWWAGPIIGVMNLIPVLPLDGGHLAQTGLEVVLGERAMRVMAIGSLVVTASAAILLIASGRGGFAIFVAFLLFNQFQIVQATSKNPRAKPLGRHNDAESTAWQTGQPGILEPGQQLSPWYRAHRALMTGDRDGAVRTILDDLQTDGAKRWAPPIAASPHQLQAVIDVLPQQLPPGNLYSGRILTDIFLATGHRQRAGEYAAQAFGHQRSSTMAATVARSAAGLGDSAIALQWLQAAAETIATEPDGYGPLLAQMMDRAGEFAPIRDDTEFRRIRARLT